jgi:hypothetical protein
VQQLTLRLEANLVVWFKDHAPKGEDYQTDINRALREHVQWRARKAGWSGFTIRGITPLLTMAGRRAGHPCANLHEMAGSSPAMVTKGKLGASTQRDRFSAFAQAAITPQPAPGSARAGGW